ncbi:Hypothetical predicted protein [Paramuricea clavata]|uniref:Uncharacterized protein n=1 Tax=Paramuricea clavata TaxID=317549 RepID=A0A7D9HZY1_PARCT|nr:Hypothetical predicted protein [Paramuricea clavata]
MLDFPLLFCRASACLFSATEHCHDSIEIATLDTDRGECLLQYANLAFEKLTGYSRKDVIGRTTRLGPYPSNCKDSGSGLDEQIYSQLEKGKMKEWKDYTSQKKNGETFKQNLQIIPVIGRGGKIAHLVAVKQEVKASTGGSIWNKLSRENRGSKDTVIFNSSPRPSISSAKLEPYMTIVINMINSAKEGSSPSIATKLSRAIVCI